MTVTSAIQTWQPLKIGGGGWLTGFDQHSDGTLVCRTDTFGAYIRRPGDTTWSQLFTKNSLPSTHVHTDFNRGVFDIRIAPTNSSIIYSEYMGYIFKSTDMGRTWVETAFPRNDYWNMDPNGGWRFSSPRIAIDPINANVVYVGTVKNGLYRTLDGGATWSQRTDVLCPTTENGRGVSTICFDPTASTVVVSGVTTTATVWCSSATYGPWRSTDGGQTFSIMTTDGPTAQIGVQASFDAAGNFFFSTYLTAGADSGKLWRYDGSWTDTAVPTGANLCYGVACDPATPGRIIAYSSTGSRLVESLNSGTTWGTLKDNSGTRAATDVPWLAATAEVFMTAGQIAFDKTGVANKLLFSQGIGFWTTTLASGFTSSWTWTSMTAGVEQLVANRVLAMPNGNLFLTAWDRPIWKITNPAAYPSAHLPDMLTAIRHGWGFDYNAQDQDELVCAMTSASSGAGSCRSTDGGTTWELFGTEPPWGTAEASSGVNYGAGVMAIAAANNYLWQPSAGRRPWYTTDGGDTWTGVTMSGFDNTSDNTTGWGRAGFDYYAMRRSVCADRVTAGTFYMEIGSRGVWRSTDGGANWTQRLASALISDSIGVHRAIECPPGQAGHIWFAPGHYSTGASGWVTDWATPQQDHILKYSEDGGTSWTSISNSVVREVKALGFGKNATGETYPTVWIVGFVYNGVEWVPGVHYSPNKGVDWVTTETFPTGLDAIKSIDGDKNTFGKAYIGFNGSGFAYTTGSRPGSYRLQF